VPSPSRPVVTAIDATPLLGVRTGVGASVAGFITALADEPGVDVVGYSLSAAAGKSLPEVLPPATRAGRSVPIPAAALLRMWALFDHPAVELWTGPVDVVHGTNFVVPPARNAARLVTVHDLTSVRFPSSAVRHRCGIQSHPPSPRPRCVGPHGFPVGGERDRRPLPSRRDSGPCHPQWADTPAGPLPRDQAEPPYMLAIGTVEPRKGLSDLVAAFDRIADSIPDVHLKIAGPGGWGEDALDAGIRSARHRDRIHRIGWVEDRSTLMAGARLLAYPSLYEGFGLPPLEAMSLGVPVVATTAGAIPEVVGDAALLVAPGDGAALAEALLVAATDATARARLIAAGTERVPLFTWERAGRQLADLYRSLASARG